MPSNKELSDEILKLNPAALVDGLNNVALSGLLSSLKSTPPSAAPSDPALFDPVKEAAKADDAEEKRLAKAKEEAAAEAKAQAEANAAQEAAVKGDATHKVAEGKAITCKREVISSDDPEDKGGGRVSARDFHQGDIDIARLVAAGVLVKL